VRHVGIRDAGGEPDVLQQARWHLQQPGNIGSRAVAAGPFLGGPGPVNPNLSLRLAYRRRRRQCGRQHCAARHKARICGATWRRGLQL